MKMHELIEAIEREQLDEVDPQTLFKLGYGAAGAIATSPIWAPIAGKVAGAAVTAAVDAFPKRKGMKAAAQEAFTNKQAEQCYKKGGKDCACADGFHYDRSKGKCVKNTLGSGIKRLFNK